MVNAEFNIIRQFWLLSMISHYDIQYLLFSISLAS